MRCHRLSAVLRIALDALEGVKQNIGYLVKVADHALRLGGLKDSSIICSGHNTSGGKMHGRCFPYPCAISSALPEGRDTFVKYFSYRDRWLKKYYAVTKWLPQFINHQLGVKENRPPI
jgi:hypothetical protein